MSHEYVYKISSRYLQKWLRYSRKHVKNRHFSRHFGTLPCFSEFCFLTDFDASKSVLGSFFAFFTKIWPKNMYRSSKSRNFFVWPFSPGDLRWPWPVLWSQSTGNNTDVSDTIHADSLALFALNIDILLADVTKPEKSKMLTLTWPVTSSVTSGSNVWPCTGSSRTGLSNGVWNLEIGPVVWEISGGPFAPPPPPAGRVTNQTPAGRGLRKCQWSVQHPSKSWILDPVCPPYPSLLPQNVTGSSKDPHCPSKRWFNGLIPTLAKDLSRSMIQDPQDPAAIFQTRSKIHGISQKLRGQDPGSTGSFDKMPAQDPSRSRILDPAEPGSRIFLGSWHMSETKFGQNRSPYYWTESHWTECRYVGDNALNT